MVSSLVEKGGRENGRKGNGADGHGYSFAIQLKREEGRLSLSFLFFKDLFFIFLVV